MVDEENTNELHIGLNIPDLSKLNQDIKNCLIKSLGEYDGEKTYILVLEGTSASGKSTFGKILKSAFKKSGYKTNLIAVDNYIKHPYNHVNSEDVLEHNFDSPQNYLFDEIAETLKLLLEGKPADKWTRDHKEGAKKTGKKYQQNPHIIIIEGIMASTLVNENIYNHEKFNPRDVPNEDDLKKKDFYIKNIAYDPIKEKAKVLKIYFDICLDAMLNIRRIRDYKFELYNENPITFKNLMQALKKVQIRILKWVCISDIYMIGRDKKKNIVLHHGSFNESGFNTLYTSIMDYFKVKNYNKIPKIIKNTLIDEDAFSNCKCYQETPTILKPTKNTLFKIEKFDEYDMSHKKIMEMLNKINKQNKKSNNSIFKILNKLKVPGFLAFLIILSGYTYNSILNHSNSLNFSTLV